MTVAFTRLFPMVVLSSFASTHCIGSCHRVRCTPHYHQKIPVTDVSELQMKHRIHTSLIHTAFEEEIIPFKALHIVIQQRMIWGVATCAAVSRKRMQRFFMFCAQLLSLLNVTFTEIPSTNQDKGIPKFCSYFTNINRGMEPRQQHSSFVFILGLNLPSLCQHQWNSQLTSCFNQEGLKLWRHVGSACHLCWPKNVGCSLGQERAFRILDDPSLMYHPWQHALLNDV